MEEPRGKYPTFFLIYDDDKMSKIVSEESFSSSIVATEQEATKAPNSASYSERRLELCTLLNMLRGYF